MSTNAILPQVFVGTHSCTHMVQNCEDCVGVSSHRPNWAASHVHALMLREGNVCTPGGHFFTFADVRPPASHLLEDIISSCANRILVILANPKTAGAFVRRTEHHELCYRVLRENLQVRLGREKESLSRRSELASREISWASYRLSAKFGLTVFGPRHLDSCA